jgi:LytS/YehU family sensor histidine kinase
VPYLILQPIVENAVRHGIAERAGAGRIEVRASTAKDRLSLAVEDDGVGPGGDAASSRTGIGLANIRARLEQLYGAEGSVTIDSRPGRGSRVTVLMPLQRGAGLEVAAAPRT